MSSQVITAKSTNHSFPLRKYDKRVNNAPIENLGSEAKPGPKPRGRKDLLGRRAVTELRKMHSMKRPHEMYADAIKAKNYALAWQIMQDVEARALGRPYVAVNPDAVERHEQADISRIAVAIQNLNIVQAPASKRKQRETIERQHPQVIDSAMLTDGMADRQTAVQAAGSASDQAIEAAAKPGTLG